MLNNEFEFNLNDKERFERQRLKRAERKRLQKFGDTSGRKESFTFDHYVYYYNLAVADALYCELAMSAEQIRDLFIKIDETMKCMRSGNLDIDSLHDMVEEELGITFVRGVSKHCLKE